MKSGVLGLSQINYTVRTCMRKENPFKKIGYPPKEVPTALKQRLIEDISKAKPLMDMASSVKKNYKKTLSNMFLTKKSKGDNS